MLDEVILLRKIKRGDIKAFEHVFRSYYGSLCLYAVGITGRVDIAEEIVQDLFYIIWKDRATLNIFHSISAYLYRSVRNRSLQYCKRSGRESGQYDLIIDRAENQQNSPMGNIEYEELKNLIDKTLKKMPERRRNIFTMHRFEGKKYQEIADLYSISVKTVEVEMSKALHFLKEEVEKYNYVL